MKTETHVCFSTQQARTTASPFGASTSSNASDPIFDLILSSTTQKQNSDGRERREAEKELEMQEEKKIKRR